MSDSNRSNDPPQPQSTGRQVYNVITDTGTGVNVRWKDNVYQAIAIMVCLALGALIGFLVTADRGLGAVAGGFAGLLVGLFGSGIFLMVFRGIRHFLGKLD
jgi:hypothetical protein